MAKPLGFKDFIVVDYKPGLDDLASYKATKRKREQVEPEVDEALNFQQRQKRARIMKRIKARLKMGRNKAKARTADLPRLKKRAKKAALNQLFKKYSKGKSRSELPPARRAEIEKRIAKMGAKVDRIAKKLLPKVRQKEKDRKSARNAPK